MKTRSISSIICLMILSLMFACKNAPNQTEMVGIYVNHAGGEYSVADDSLVVEHDTENKYLIHRKTGFNLIRDGKKSKREYETEEWRAIYNTETQALTETRRGKTITFYGDKLMVGYREYKKIN